MSPVYAIKSLVITFCFLLFLSLTGSCQQVLAVKQYPTYQFSQDILQDTLISKANEQTKTDASAAANERAAVAASFIGEYKLALKLKDQTYQSIPKISPSDSIYFLSFKPSSAQRYILDRSVREKIIMLNEAHHIPLHRVFTLSLLSELFNQGYRYLGVETLSDGDTKLNERGYPITSQTDYSQNSGYYTAEPQYGNLVREAIKLGFKVFSYDYTSNSAVVPTSQEREIQQAKNIQTILLKDPTAKIVIHAGYEHIREDYIGGEWIKAMAGRVKELTGIDPFTINQEKLTEKSNIRFENPYYRLVQAKEASIFTDNSGNVFSGPKGSFMYDVRVFHPHTLYQYGRPEWLQLKGRRKPYFIQRVRPFSYPCLVFAYHDGEDIRTAVATDIVELRSESERKKNALILDSGRYTIVVKCRDGSSITTSVKVK